MNPKKFDCMAMKRKASLRIYEETKGMTLEERQDYWRRKNEVFLQNQRARQAKRR